MLDHDHRARRQATDEPLERREDSTLRVRWIDDGKVEPITPLPPAARIASVNGAGDAQAAGTVYGLAGGLGFLAALRYGKAAAALKIESEESVRGDLTPTLLESRAAAGAEKTA